MDVKTARHNFHIRAKMLCDFHRSLGETTSSIASRVIKRQFDKYYTEFVQAYEALVASDAADIENLGQEFSEINGLLIAVEIKMEELDAGPSKAPSVKRDTSSDPREATVAAKLPFIELGQFNGNPRDWVSFYDLFLSLVHNRSNLPATEKHYYLRSCLKGEPLTLVKHLPVDAANYEVALGLLRDRYQNTRLLADTYLEQIVSLPKVPTTLDGLRQAFYNPLLESTQALQKLGLPVAEWSYLLLFLILQKLPTRLRNQFEERCGATAEELPTFSSLMGLLDEICRRQLVTSPTPEQDDEAGPQRHRRSSNAQPKATTSRDRRSPSTSRARGQVSVAVTEVRCLYCTKLGHDISGCYEFKRLACSARKSWVRSNGACFVCLGRHYARDCARGNGCGFCGSDNHHTLLCARGSAPERTQQQRAQPARYAAPAPARQPPRARTPPHQPSPPRVRTPPRHASPVEHRTVASQQHPPEREEAQPYRLEPGQRQVGARYRRAHEQFEELRYGQPNYSPTPEPEVTLGIRNSEGDFEEARALLDTGASVSAIREALVDRLRLHRQRSTMEIIGVGNSTVRTPSSKVKVVIRPIDKRVPIISTVAVVMQEVTADLPVNRISPKGILKRAPPTLKLADKYFSLPTGVDLILGTDVLNYVFDGTKIDIDTGGAAAYGTCFGHAIMGPADGYVTAERRPVSTTTLTEAVKRFWTSEEPPMDKPMDPRHEECERLYETTTERLSDGKFMVRLPLLSNKPELGDSLDTATRRFYALERKMDRHPVFASKYREFMADYEKLGHMSISDFRFDAEHYVIPHHGIFKRDSDKIRVVFDGSCKTTTGVSINECLHSGEPLQNDITKILMNFRRHQVVFTTDVKQMFRMTWIHPEDRRYQLILWRSDPSQELKVYELNTNTYGLRSSPYIAIRTLLELATRWEQEHPGSRAAEVVRHNVYTDDILTGAGSLQDAEVLMAELIQLMQSAGYELRKWSTNDLRLLKDLPDDHCEQPKQFDATDTKGFIKELFMDGLHWDEAVSEAIVNKWLDMIEDLFHLEILKIPRCIALPDAVSYSLHGFGDASEAGYAACIYLRSEDAFGNVKGILDNVDSATSDPDCTTVHEVLQVFGGRTASAHGGPACVRRARPFDGVATDFAGPFLMLQKLHQNVWARWHLEYLSTLQQRNKWYRESETLNLNDLVFIKDENAPPLHWKLGRVLELYKGKDNVVRSVKLRTQSGELVRPAIKLYKLPLEG
ncbi:hypothetical protein evm_014603 [Chilo suppressalis]|nr:hypothetical protein evm_014603 [Chilo suppressalis]